MTEYSWPWSTVAGLGDGASELGESQSRSALATVFRVQDPSVEGVSVGVGNELEVTGVASPLQVDTGSAICYGLYWSDAAVNVAVTTPAVGTTGGRIVLQTYWAGSGGASLEARTRIALKLSADGVASPPGVTQTVGVVWEISLATFTITTGGVIAVTDDRTFRKSTAMVDTNEIEDSAITLGKLAAAVAAELVTNGDSHDHVGGDGAPIQAGGLANGAVDTTARLANNIVDDTKVGNRVAQFYRRQGGDASDFSVAGTTTYTPTAVRVQWGSVNVAFTSATHAEVRVTFPTAFSDVPIVLISMIMPVIFQDNFVAKITDVTATYFDVDVRPTDGITTSFDDDIFWQAIGPE